MTSPRLDEPRITPRVRTRQGCQPCRRRRRKCDEDKPSCQNCIKKGLRCKYGIQLTFHTANLFELDAHEARDFRMRAPEKYQNLQFVDGLREILAERSQSHPNERPSPTLNSLETETGIAEPAPEKTISIAPRGSIQYEPHFQHDYDDNALGHNYDAIECPQTLLEDSLRIESMGSSITSAIYQSNERAVDRSCHSQSGSLGPGRMSDIDSSTSNAFASPSRVSSRTSISRVQLRNLDAVASEPGNHPNVKTSQELLKYYIDKVAPWLELCSLDGLYSIHIPLVSSRYEPLRQVILALAASQNCGEGTAGLQASFLQASLQNLRSDVCICREETIVTRHLHIITRQLTLPMREWRSVLSHDISNCNELNVHGFSGGIGGAVAWLALRFDLATSLTSQSPPITNLETWNRIQILSPSFAGISTDSTHVHEVLYLCAEVLDFSHSTTRRNDAERWNPFLYRLHELQKFRSSVIAIPLLSSPIGKTSFSTPVPISQSPKIPTSFPVFIFTTRISFYNSFLLHITQLLLVLCKPRNIEHGAVTKLKTAPWYAVQICGLSLSNPEIWSWDPLIVAALLFAGSFLSYSEQQLELMEHMEALREMTGWRFEQEIQGLQEFWSAGCE